MQFLIVEGCRNLLTWSTLQISLKILFIYAYFVKKKTLCFPKETSLKALSIYIKRDKKKNWKNRFVPGLPQQIRTYSNPQFYLIRVCSILMFCSIAGVTEGLRATRELAHVGLLPGVGSQVGLQVLQTRVRFTAALKLNKINSQFELVAVMKQSNRGQNVWTKRV